MKEYAKNCGIALIDAQLVSRRRLDNVSYLAPGEVGFVMDFHKSIPFYRPSPMVSLSSLAEKLGVKAVYVKDESKRFAEFGLGAFKGLGGIFAVGQVICRRLGLDPRSATYQELQTPEAREKSKDMVFITTTDGNHGRGVAWAAAQYGCKSYVYMPKGSAKARQEAIKRVGAEDCIITDMNYDDTVAYTSRLAQEKGWHLVQDTAWEGYTEVPQLIVQGYTTLAQEALEQMGQAGDTQPTHVFLQAGVGSFAGAMLGYYANKFECPPAGIIVEPTDVACFYHSARINDGKPHGVMSAENTIMAGLNCGEPSIGVWPAIRDLAEFYIACDDDVTMEGMRLYARPVGTDQPIVSGESAAVGLGLINRILGDRRLAEMKEALGFDENSVILLISTEGNTDPEGYERIVNGK